MMNRRNFIKNSLTVFPLLTSRTLLDTKSEVVQLSESKSLEQGQRARARDLGIIIGNLSPGPLNAITDVPGIKVGQTTIIEGHGKKAVRT